MPRHSAERRVEPDPLEVARELLDRVDRADALDLHRDPAVVVVAAHQVDRPDVRRPLAPHEPEALAAPAGRGGERLLQVGLDAVLLQARVALHVVRGVGDHLGEPDLEPVVALELAHDDQALRLLDHRRRRHPVQRLVPAGVGVHEHRAVGLDHQQPQRLGQMGGQAAGVVDGAAGDDQAHRGKVLSPSCRTATARPHCASESSAARRATRCGTRRTTTSATARTWSSRAPRSGWCARACISPRRPTTSSSTARSRPTSASCATPAATSACSSRRATSTCPRRRWAAPTRAASCSPAGSRAASTTRRSSRRPPPS